MGDSESSAGYRYLFGEADEITKRLDEYHRNRGRVLDDSPVHVSLPEYSSELDNSPMINYQLQNQTAMFTHFHSSEHYSSQDISHLDNHRQFQTQPMYNTRQHTMYNTQHRRCWKCLISMLISWLMGLFIPRPRPRPIRTPIPFNTYQHSLSEHFEDRPNQPSVDEIIQRRHEGERVNIGEGLTERQFSQLPTIRFQPSMEDKKCMICQSDYANREKITVLPCTHKYHKDCIRHWLQNSKLCCVCQREVVV